MKDIFIDDNYIVFNNSKVYGIKNISDVTAQYEPKYKKQENGFPHEKVIVQYKKILNTLKIKSGVVLDFGCCMGHASKTIKDYSKNLTYIGADVSTGIIKGGAEIWSPDYLYKINYNVPCLSAINSKKIDLVIMSRVTDWTEYNNFIPEILRVLKPGGFLFIRGNRTSIIRNAHHNISFKGKDLINKAKKDIFSFFINNLNVSKEEASLGIWGGKDSYVKSIEQLSSEELRKSVGGLYIKK